MKERLDVVVSEKEAGAEDNVRIDARDRSRYRASGFLIVIFESSTCSEREIVVSSACATTMAAMNGRGASS